MDPRGVAQHSPPILILNAGLHYHHNLTMLQDITAAQLDLFANLPPSIRPRVFWRQTTAQHFPVSDGIFQSYRVTNKSVRQCAALAINETRNPRTSEANVYNRATDPIVLDSGHAKMLDVW
eukprot:CAMPEP_0119306672 /NCGR_PEP_ID=MMETSP1333-20130426/7366_1 /TAXON_ID=418940 /ORGANISM="Scyphosphaera apsteinii, Strain RCC1455" /LENGTH=120 /DNA_ID=CAMNT_0007310031 /DNA_START=139 /DNA_END=498 /DNA_ORIENTATION=-